MPVFINNVDDYLGPSQACVNPLFTAPPNPQSTNNNNGEDGGKNPNNGSSATHPTVSKNQQTGRRRIPRRVAPRTSQQEDDRSTIRRKVGGAIRLAHETNDGADENDLSAATGTSLTRNDYSSNKPAKSKKATVSLSDCLSCSGCVTSAEAVLMSHHSVETLKEVTREDGIKGKRNRLAFTISSASLADLYRHLYLENRKENDGSSEFVGCMEDDPSSMPQEKPSRYDLLKRLTLFLHREFQAELVIDGEVSQRISLMESAEEFVHRFRRKNDCESVRDSAFEGVKAPSVPSVPSIAISSTKTRYIYRKTKTESDMNGGRDGEDVLEVTTLDHPPGRWINEDELEGVQYVVQSTPNAVNATVAKSSTTVNEKDDQSSTANKFADHSKNDPCSLPMLSSSCPGFVCLVEKTAPSVIPLLSSAKSPMAIAGTLVQTGITEQQIEMGSEEKRWYHVAVMPCHDKKMEAGRNDLAWERQVLQRYSGLGYNNSSNIMANSDLKSEDLVKEVDLVLTTDELLEILSASSEKSTTQSQKIDIPDGAKDNVSVEAVCHLLESLENEDPPSKNRCWLMTERTFHSPNNNTTDTTNNATDFQVAGSSDVAFPSEIIASSCEVETGVHGSGSYADFIFRHAAWKLFRHYIPEDEPLPWKSPSLHTGAFATSSALSGSGSTKATEVIRRRRRRQETTDLKEVTLYRHSDGTYSCNEQMDSETHDDSNTQHFPTPVLRFATAYGFKNVQLILQTLSKQKANSQTSHLPTSIADSSTYDYVEIMACPSGCTNGGGQVGSQGKRETPRETKERVRKTASAIAIVRPFISDTVNGQTTSSSCNGISSVCVTGDSVGEARSITNNLNGNDYVVKGGCFGKGARHLFHTRFHNVPKLELSTGATAGVAVSDTQW